MNQIVPMTDEELKALQARRVEELKSKQWWQLSVEELARAYAAGMRVFDHANLYNAKLYYANLLGAIGLYSAYAPNLSSRGASLNGKIIIADGKLELRFDICSQAHDLTPDQLRERVRETHGDSIHVAQYEAAIVFTEAVFATDMKFGKWDYLLEMNAEKEES